VSDNNGYDWMFLCWHCRQFQGRNPCGCPLVREVYPLPFFRVSFTFVIHGNSKDDAVALGKRLWDAAEGGFFERRTHETLAAAFRGRGFSVEEFAGMPGFAATVDCTLEGKTVAVIADMDGLPAGGKTEAGAPAYSHLCGHHQQMAAMYGAACALQEQAPALLPRVAFLAVPAEEYVELERREELRKAGAVRHLSGKQELIARGVFSGFRAVVATHSAHLPDSPSVNSVVAMNGFEVLRFAFHGVSAHAGATPHLGRNAQNAGSLFLQAAAFLRESFDEEMHIRIHPVLRLKPDQAVNLVPDAAFVETYVRAAESGTVAEIAGRLEAAAAGCASALGTTVRAERVPGYAAFHVDRDLHEALRAFAAEQGVGFVEDLFSAASSDMGDVSQVVPSIIVGLPGTNGKLHQSDFGVTDEQAAYTFSGRFLAGYVRKVLTGI
jgi:amidohydrolase